MKKRILALIMSLAMLCSASAFASAEESTEIKVQLDGQDLAFTDAVPQVKDNRTFLPFRTVFEALGATVSNEGNVVTAVRGDTTLTMTIGQTDATVTKDGVAESLVMDVAPYVDNTTWRTYVPVRFAADAFGCNVGWDQEAMTAIIVDVDKLMDEALADHEFTVLDKFMTYSEKYSTGNWAMEAEMDAQATALGSQVLTLDGSFTGLTANAAALEVAAEMNMDMTGLMNLIASMSGTTLEAMGVTAEDLKMSLDMGIRGDLATGLLYINYGEAFNAQLGLSADTWLSMDLAALYGGMGIDWSALMDVDYMALTKTLLASVPLDGMAADGYQQLSGILQSVVTALSDESFKATDDGYATTFTLPVDGASLVLDLALSTDRSGEVNGYSCDFTMELPFDAETQATLAQQGITADGITFVVNSSVDENDEMSAVVAMDVGTAFTLDMTVTGGYDATDKAPNTLPPEGAPVVDLMSLLTQAAGAAV